MTQAKQPAPIEPETPPRLLGRGAWLVLGIALFAAACFAAFLTWSLLPPGRYPILVAAVPAFPVIYLAWLALSKSGVFDPRPKASGPTPMWKLYLIAIAILFVGMLILAPFIQ